ncbi:MAG: hypothetical protein ACFB8W_09260 [Elainellaceae cyanobacterium]
MNTDPSIDLNDLNNLSPSHFADLIRMAQLIFDPSGGLSGSQMRVDWEAMFGIPPSVVENLRLLGAQYQYEMPHIEPELIWRHLDLDTRQWFIAHKNMLWRFEEAFPARDED